MDYDRIRQTFERLNRSGVLEMANRLSAQHKERITEMQKQPLAMVAAAHQKRMERILESFTMPSVSPEAYRTANSIAAQALRVSERSRLRAINAINAGQFDNIVQRASALVRLTKLIQTVVDLHQFCRCSTFGT